jgi:ATP adenylyltransferase
MEPKILHAPWRMEYIRTLEKPDGDACFVCLAAAASSEEERRQRLVLWDTEQSIVLINRFPYTNGHLLICPRAHKGDLDQLTDAEHLDLQRQTTLAVRLLRRAVGAQGFNLGRAAGAGLPGHLHHHVVPRWSGDTNFFSVVGEVRIVPQAMSQLYEELLRAKSGL